MKTPPWPTTASGQQIVDFERLRVTSLVGPWWLVMPRQGLVMVMSGRKLMSATKTRFEFAKHGWLLPQIDHRAWRTVLIEQGLVLHRVRGRPAPLPPLIVDALFGPAIRAQGGYVPC